MLIRQTCSRHAVSPVAMGAPSHADRAVSEVGHADVHVDERRAAVGGGGERAAVLVAELVVARDERAVAAERRRHAVVVVLDERARHVVVEDAHLIAVDLPPRAVVAHHAHDADAEARHGVELHHTVAARAIAPDEHHVHVGPRELGADGEAGADAERAERPRVEPLARPARPQHVRRGAHEVAAVGHQYRVVVHERLERAERV
mmetsp:Transcript_22202/g.54239  ORF Transcript_22202/g.54239 Transcript_22202/m.54239 type:complete len:204 (+) Transcript_22202:15-626(+)